MQALRRTFRVLASARQNLEEVLQRLPLAGKQLNCVHGALGEFCTRLLTDVRCIVLEQEQQPATAEVPRAPEVEIARNISTKLVGRLIDQAKDAVQKARVGEVRDHIVKKVLASEHCHTVIRALDDARLSVEGASSACEIAQVYLKVPAL